MDVRREFDGESHVVHTGLLSGVELQHYGLRFLDNDNLQPGGIYRVDVTPEIVARKRDTPIIINPPESSRDMGERNEPGVVDTPTAIVRGGRDKGGNGDIREVRRADGVDDYREGTTQHTGDRESNSPAVNESLKAAIARYLATRPYTMFANWDISHADRRKLAEEWLYNVISEVLDA